jgi:glyoxylase-like metal-dependent hydrolase (beta-lactamase superfamily II)
MSPPLAVPLAPDVHLLDLRFQGFAGAVAAFLLADGDDLVLVETGPGSTLPALRAAIAAAGHALERVTHVVVTHIHLDHAGAAGAVLREAPRARFHVHPAGAPHMVDPSKLLASATRIYGDAMDRLWGAFEPVPADRLTPLGDGDAVRFGRGRRLVALHTPGHASHHVALHDPDRGDVYTGDVAGVRLAGAAYVRPPTPPPDVDLDAWRASVARLRALDARRLLLTHFGAATDAAWHLDELLARLFDWSGWLEARLELQGDDVPAIVAALTARGAREVERAVRAAGLDALDPALRGDDDPEALVRRLVLGYELATPSHMTVSGIARWLRVRG